MADSSTQYMAIHVVWHPKFRNGEKIARALFHHFRSPRYRNVIGDSGINVMYRQVVEHGSDRPLAIDFEESRTLAVIVLLDPSFARDQPWVDYLNDLCAKAEKVGFGARVYPIVFKEGLLARTGITMQALRWHTWTGSFEARALRLIGELTYAFCRMQRYYLEHLKHPTANPGKLQDFIQKVKVFISHSKHDDDGAAITKIIDRKLREHSLESFFDIFDIAAGVDFQKVIIESIPSSTVIAVHTDSFSSREWCRREVLEAKRHNVPLVVASSIATTDFRSFPYMGNVPVVRLDPKKQQHFEVVIFTLLDETLRDFLWRCRVELVRNDDDSNVTYVPRPPELMTLAHLPVSLDGSHPIIVYPDPPLGAEEERLFHSIMPNVQLRSMKERLAEAYR